ncbi:MAG: cytochrome c biogenesis protein CcsA [candidate division Zixibacteria bacterium]|nr:cytochrome c biogenesis protein CcsA [candidate division Zixibacteria bacterium]
MLLGNLSLSLALLAALFSAFFFLMGAKGNERFLEAGKRIYYLFFFFTLFASAYLLYLFLTHHFEVEYIYNHSSSELPWFYLVSGFWAGQEGSFLLWLFLGSLLGIFIFSGRSKTKSDIHQGYTMFFYLLVQISLLVLLLKKSPFSLLPGFPAEGRGLHPLLQDFWMVIHPPVVFIGYAAVAVPFAYALSALVMNKYEGWTRSVLPWVGFSCLSLGAGIFLGSYWAYKVLGWGGYWGWDPVENAPLIPWLLCIALMHGLLMEKTKGCMRRTNFLLAILPFLLILYGTFLVRSGVLGEFSVHSFTDLGTSAYLLLFMIFFSLFSIGLFIFRLSNIQRIETTKNILSSEFSISVAIVFLCVSALLILLGTSSPLITSIFGPASNVDITFYVRTQLPLAIIVVFVLGVVPFLSWNKTSWNEFIKKISLPLLIAFVLTILAFVLKVRFPIYLILMFVALLAFVGNLFLFIKKSKKGLKFVGGYLSHLGVGVLLVGIISSSGYSRSIKLSLPINEAKEAFGYKFTYLGTDHASLSEKDAVKVKVQKGDKNFIARPKFYYSEFTQGMLRHPHIEINFLNDLYLAPLKLSLGEEEKLFSLQKGETKNLKGYTIKFVDFDMTTHSKVAQVGVGAILEVEKNDQKKTLIPAIVMGRTEGDQAKNKVQLPGGEDYLILEKIDADRRMIDLSLVLGAEQTSVDLLLLNVSKKPLINLYWLGTVLILLGLVIATYRRTKETTINNK